MKMPEQLHLSQTRMRQLPKQLSIHVYSILSYLAFRGFQI